MTTAAAEGRALAELAAAMYARGWLEGTAGNLSVRLAGGQTALITASGVSKGSLTAADVVEVGHRRRAAGRSPDSPRPSAETTIHAALYRLSDDCRAVVHAHPPYATTAAIRAARRGAAAVEFTDFEILKGLGLPDPSKVVVPVFENHAHVPAHRRRRRGPARRGRPAGDVDRQPRGDHLGPDPGRGAQPDGVPGRDVPADLAGRPAVTGQPVHRHSRPVENRSVERTTP